MTAAGFAWLASGLSAADDDLLYTIGELLDGLFPAVLGHLLLAFPTGRLDTRAERLVVAGAYFAVTVLQVPSLLFEEPGEPRNLLIVEGDQPLSDALDAMQYAVAIGLIVASWIIIVRRERAQPRGRAWRPVLWTGGVSVAGFVVAKGFDAVGSPSDALELISQALVATIPFGFLVGLLRSRLAQGEAVAELIARVGEAPGEGELRAALADALGDPSVALAYWLPESERYVDALGHPVTVSGAGWTEVELGGRRVAAIAHHPDLDDEPQLVRAAGAAAALALENQRLEAELRARIEELRSLTGAARGGRRHGTAPARARPARRRPVAARRGHAQAQAGADEDGGVVGGGGAARRGRRRAAGLARTSCESWRAVSIRRSSPTAASPRRWASWPSGRPCRSRCRSTRCRAPSRPRSTSSSSEGLTNVAKYAHASSVTVAVRRDASGVTVEIADDGVGGADVAAGSGLRGLADRVGALDGRIEVESPAGGGTTLRAEIPC